MVQRFARSIAAFALATPVVFAQEKEAPKPSLTAGMPAPALSVEKWVKGSPIASFEKGRIYVIEFWATWCGPCIRSMPHISALQADYKDRGVTIIGTSIWEDRKEPYSTETLDKVETFVAKQGDRMAYTVAYDGATKYMEQKYVRAAGRNGIPCAFIVDGTGTLAWIGDPRTMDFALSEVAAGKWDVKTGPDREKKVFAELSAIQAKLETDAAGAQAAFEKFAAAYPAVAKHQEELRDELELAVLKAGGQWTRVYEILGQRIDAAIARKDAASLNMIAWGIVDPEATIKERNVELALRAALKADEFTGNKDPAILDTVARCYATKGEMKKAIETQMRAVDSAKGEMKASLEKTLEEYKSKGAQ